MAISRAAYYHTELINWNKWIDFYRDEIALFEKWLSEQLKQDISISIKAKTEHFQNQFIIQKENFDILQHDIHEQEAKIKNDIIKDDMLINLPVIDTQYFLRDRMQAAEKIIIDLKYNFYKFLEMQNKSVCQH